jgi:hypothetical protein
MKVSMRFLDHQEGWHITIKQRRRTLTTPLEIKDHQGGT